jgi:putative zinc finger/helix-turn-helix YgiT family protein
MKKKAQKTSVPMRREEVPFGLAGTWAATVEALVYDCPNCGRGVLYESPGKITQAIAAAVIKKPSRLAAEEIRFLRGHLGMTAKQFGSLLGVSGSQVSRWENGAKMGPAADRLLRMIEVQHDHLEFDVQLLRSIAAKPGAPMALRVMRTSDGQWKAAA